MDVSLIINTHEIREYIAENGIDVSTEQRVYKAVMMLDGTEYRHSVPKRKLDVKLLENILGTNISVIKGYLETNPASVTYSNYETGLSFSGTFYVTDFKYTIKKNVGGDVVISNASFSLEEQ